ncbi:hypothetical protein ZWY2020_001511 [Hordeum vulgare]|nr:hypothetical protein ZWY2020_001511 [Hordeum vulgare]
MEQFHHGHHVRLRSRVRGAYLHADEDGHGVSLHRRRDSMNVAWAVHLRQGPPHAQYMHLHSAAYGRYLAATTVPAPLGHRGLRVEQRNYNHPEVTAILWLAIRSESGDEVLLRHFDRGYLRANGRYLPWNNGASVDDADVNDTGNLSTMTHWVVEPIPAREAMPPLPRPTGVSEPAPCPLLDSSRISFAWEQFLALFLPNLRVLCLPHLKFVLFATQLQLPFPDAMSPSRVITYAWRSFRGDLITSGSIVFRGRSVFRLREELARLLGALAILGVDDIIMCLPTRDGRLFPLVVDLPSSRQSLHIAVAITRTPGHDALRFADVDAE